ncbi:Spo0E family sporulation regulatory protein-aspartic acid phosphatase [Halobacillus salinus]
MTVIQKVRINYHQVLKFSQELDHLLNELTETKTPQINR